MKKAKAASKTTKKAKVETISELARRHLTDESHTTTDEELLNAKVELSKVFDTSEDNLYTVDHRTILPPSPGEAEEDAGDVKEENDSPVPNPYDVLGG